MPINNSRLNEIPRLVSIRPVKITRASANASAFRYSGPETIGPLQRLQEIVHNDRGREVLNYFTIFSVPYITMLKTRHLAGRCVFRKVD